ncbi:relaxase domain-containing protein [Plantibacter sp. CFBP 8775]|uniref:MobF family relaxase n=1 Tax=Plantibacter sp. CFBP 8775 TaxID=2774038 RepID=UPI00177AA057|nr:relaxase domain-containing protein [Plantibacter sp. CFBP 8775]
MSAGDGYTYYTSSVATGDIERTPGTELTDYYTADGNPPGVWIGGGRGLLGATGEVTEAQMHALFGEGLHPNADAITADMRAAGAKESEIAAAIRLGRRYYAYEVKGGKLNTAVQAGYAEFERLNGREPDRDERRQVRMREGAIAFRDHYGRQPADVEELGRFVTAAMKPGQHAVAGFDLTFSAPKSVSILWALGDKTTAAAVERAHEAARDDALAYLEGNALMTRVGVNGVAQMETEGGLIAAAFRHYDSRTGDPQLHDHVTVANKVKGVDGKWRTIDSRLLHRMAVVGSEEYNARLFDHLATELGIEAAARIATEGKRPVMEIAGIPGTLIDQFSGRRTSIKRAVKQLEKAYRKEHGRAPDAAARIKLAQQATLDTRPVKKPARALSELRKLWRADTIRSLGYDELQRLLPDAITASKDLTQGAATELPRDLDGVVAEIMGGVEAARGVWGPHHVRAAARAWTGANRLVDVTASPDAQPIARTELTDRITSRALDIDSVKLTPDHVHGTFAPLTHSTGESIFTEKKRELYTSTRVLTAEARLLAAARTDHLAPLNQAQFEAGIDLAHETARADGRDFIAAPGQLALARAFATSPRRLVVGIGPAGTGKTTSMQLVAAATRAAGTRMIGLSTAASAAAVFREEVGVDAFTIDSFLLRHEHRHGTPPPTNPAIGSGDIIIVDEAGMASTRHLERILDIAEEHGALVRLLGDDKQLSAVGGGGAFKLIAAEAGAVELDQVWRFTNHHERDASLQLRNPEPGTDPFAWYKANDRIIAGTPERMADLIFERWQHTTTDGHEAVMMAPTNDVVATLNARAQAHAISTGAVNGRRTAALSDGHNAHLGDRILTRKNDAQLRMNQGRDRVLNGDLFTVTKVHRDGSLTATHLSHGGTITLPTTYVQTSVELGYASSINRAQGITVDIGMAGADATTTMNAIYPALTRGKNENTLFLFLDEGQHMDTVLEQIAGNTDRNLTAHELIGTEHDRITNLTTLVDEHTEVAGRAHQMRFATLATNTLGDTLGDTHGSTLTRSAGWGAAAAELARAERHNLDLAEILTTTWNDRGFGDADDVGAVMHFRIKAHLDQLELDPDTTPQTLVPDASDTGRFEWAVDRTAAADPNLPDAWRDHLAERATYIDTRMTERGLLLAADPPAWTADLGPVPERPDRQKRWMRLAAEVDLYRNLYNITGDAAIPADHQDQPVGQQLQTRITAMHKSTALAHAHGNTATINPDDHAARIAALTARVRALNPTSEAAQIADTLADPDTTGDLAARIAKLKRPAAPTEPSPGWSGPTDNATPTYGPRLR